MDKSEWIKLAVTAILGALAKEVFAWLISLIKARSIKSTIKGKLSRIFTKHTTPIYMDIVILTSASSNLWNVVTFPEPLTRPDVALIAASVLLVSFWLKHTATDIALLLYRKPKAEQSTQDAS